jgi:hypothetical protein
MVGFFKNMVVSKKIHSLPIAVGQVTRFASTPALQPTLILKMVQSHLNDFVHMMIIQRIVEYLPITAAFNQGQILKAPDLMGYG